MPVIASARAENEYDHSVERKRISIIGTVKSSLIEGPQKLTKSMSFFRKDSSAAAQDAPTPASQFKLAKPNTIVKREPTPALLQQPSPHQQQQQHPSPHQQQQLGQAEPPNSSNEALKGPVKPSVRTDIQSTARTLAKSISFINRHESDDEEEVKTPPDVRKLQFAQKFFVKSFNTRNTMSAAGQDGTSTENGSTDLPSTAESPKSRLVEQGSLDDLSSAEEPALNKAQQPAVPKPYPNLVVPKKFTRRDSFIVHEMSISEDSVDEVSDTVPVPKIATPRPPKNIMRSISFVGRSAPISEENNEEEDAEPELQLVAVPQPEPTPPPPVKKSFGRSPSFLQRETAPSTNNLELVIVPEPATKLEPAKNFYYGNDCLANGAAVDVSTTPTKYSHSTHEARQIQMLREEVADLRVQIADLEQDRDAQRDLKIAFKVQAVRLGETLRSFRKFAQEQGHLRDTSTSSSAPTHALQAHEASYADDDDSTSDLGPLHAQAKEFGWLVDPEEVELQEQIGSGSTADIFKGLWRGLDAAVKCLRPTTFGDNMEGVDVFCREVEILSRQRHPYVLHMFGACLSPPDHAWIITECLSGGSLTEWLHGTKTRELNRVVPLPPLSDRLRVATEISTAMQYLHEWNPKVVHRDLKPSNVFLDEYKHVRIADFSFSRYINEKDVVLTGETGTYVYMAPEVMRHEYYTEKCDVYSYGVMLCEIVSGNPPYINTSFTPAQIACAVAEGTLRPSLPENQNPLLTDLITRSWAQEPAKRPTFADITRTLKSIGKQVTSDTLNGQPHEFFSGLIRKSSTKSPSS